MCARLLSLFFSCSVSDSFWPHRLQYTRLPCPLLSPKVCSNSCPLNQWWWWWFGGGLVAKLYPTLAIPWPIPHEAHPWASPGKNTGMGCHFLLQGIFLTQELNPGLPHCRQTLYHLSHQGSLKRTRKDKGKNGGSERLLFGAAKSQQMVTAAMKLTDTCSLEESCD